MLKKAETPNPVRLIVLRNLAGMIMSVSMFSKSKGAAILFTVLSTGMPAVRDTVNTVRHAGMAAQSGRGT